MSVLRQSGKHILTLSFSGFDPTATLIITDTPLSGPNCRRAEGNVRRLQATCYFTSARKLGVGSAPMSACLDTVAAAPGVPAATPRLGGAGWGACPGD